MKILTLGSLALLVALSSGCATITSGTSQTIAVETEKDSVPVVGANCRIVTSKGVWNLVTPATFEISKSSDDAKISCEKAGEPNGDAVAKSGFKSNTVGNVLIGGIIGIGVDAMTGAMWAYPTKWLIKLGVPDQFIIDSSLFSGREKPIVAGDTSKPAESPKVEEVKK
jgi:hypothetical protein